MSDNLQPHLSSVSPPPLPAVVGSQPLHPGVFAPPSGRHWFLRWAPLFATIVAVVIAAGAGVLYALIEVRRRGGSVSMMVMAGGVSVIVCMVLLMAAIIGLVIAAAIKIFRGPFLSSFSYTYPIAAVFFAIVGLLSGMGQMAGYSRKFDKRSALREIEGMENDMQSHFSGTAESGVPAKTDRAPTDDMGRLRQLMNAHFAEVNALQKDYSDALDESGIHTLLDAGRVAKDAEFKESRTILAGARKAVDEFSGRSRQMIDALPEKFDRKPFSAANRASMRKGFEKELDIPRKIDAEIWELEMASLNHMEELIDHLQEKRELWQAQDGTFLFQRDEDVEKYNAIMAEITACVTKQEEIREHAKKSASGRLEELKETLSE